MNFLNSAFLAGLVAALIPLVIHLLNRRRLKTIEFSSVMFLRDLRRTRMRRLQLRRWLLLLVRTLLVAMAVLAFARPALKGGVFASLGSRARTTAVIAVDCSASMALETQNGTAHERALARVGEIAEFWGEGDEGIGLPFAGSSTPQYDPPTADFDALADRLRESTAGYGATDAGGALTAALATLAQARNLNREIYMLSDFRREGFVRTVVESPAGDDAGEEITVYIVDVSEAGGFDLGVTNVALANQLIEPGSPFTVTASVTNHTDRPVDRILVSIFLDGRRVAQGEAHVAASGTVTVEFQVSVETAGVHDGFVEISADDNARNNRRYFAFVIPEEIKVLLVSDYPSGRTAPALALAPVASDSRRIVVTAIGTDQLVRENVFDYDCVVVSEWRAPDPTVVEQLLRYVRAGGGVFVAPSIDADTAAWNTLIAGPHFGLRMGPRPLPPSADRYFIWERYDWNHPIWSVYGGVARDKIPEVRWHSVFRTEGTHSGNAVVSFSGGRAALSEKRLASGKLLVLWTPMGAAYTNLPLRSIFVPFMHRLVEYLSADLSERRSDFAVGEAVTREPSRTLTAGTTLEIIAPDGTRLRPGLERVGARVRLTLDNPQIPGVYRVVIPTQGDAAIDAFSVNLDPMETAAAVISRDELKRRWSGTNLVFVEPGQSLGSIVTQTRYGTEIRSSFLWAVVALFFFEMFLARTRRRDRPEATAAFGSNVAVAAPSN